MNITLSLAPLVSLVRRCTYSDRTPAAELYRRGLSDRRRIAGAVRRHTRGIKPGWRAPGAPTSGMWRMPPTSPITRVSSNGSLRKAWKHESSSHSFSLRAVTRGKTTISAAWWLPGGSPGCLEPLYPKRCYIALAPRSGRFAPIRK